VSSILARVYVLYDFIVYHYITSCGFSVVECYVFHFAFENSNSYLSNNRSRNSAVGIATGYGLDDREAGVRVPVRSRIFTSPYLPDRLWRPPNFYTMGTGGTFPGVKRPGCEADRSPPASADVKKMWIYTSTPPYAFMM
jgi:hypothetical protein